MSVVQKDSYQYVVTNVRQSGQWKIKTETQGEVVSGTTRYLTTKNPELVAEMKAKDPGILATPTFDPRLNGRKSFLMPAMPWKAKDETGDKPDKEH